MDVTVHQAYRFALDPIPRQEQMLRKWYSAGELHKLWNAEKKTNPDLAWWNQNSKCAYQEAFRDLDRALRDFTRSRRGERKGKRIGFPKGKKKGRCRDSFRFSVKPIRCSGATVTLPRLGTIRTHESTRKLSRRLADGTARILSATVSRAAQRWFVSFTVEVARTVPEHHPRPGSVLGVDLGVKTLLTGADDQGRLIKVPGPKPLRGALRKLRRASRAHSRKTKGSVNRRKSAVRLARIHAGVVCGLVLDRDVNAARNLLALAASGAERLNACGGTIRPGLAGHMCQTGCRRSTSSRHTGPQSGA